ncbi:FAD:protein FMN transferase [Clostridium tarantellae]|uniref:FAD:protein FMN transferase n=1 Tax=Clostridium tarantellae TaxID=39493 RepID=A0A6I1MNN9_9CLOT|nr:FAD:protein FMN transferase [Clostridium tarantellae]MPQ45025.1 FAD:protein FMN transferase [Clostridium tarantellae]
MNIFKKIFIKILSLILFALIFISCSNNNKKVLNETPLTKTEIFMGTAIKISIYDNKNEDILNKAFDKIKEIENLVSLNRSGTELDNLNKLAGKKPLKVSDSTFNIIKTGLKYSQLSNGDFDITIGPLVKLWSIGLPEAKVPTKNEIKNILPLINYKEVDVNDYNKTIFLKKPNMIIDLGAIAKGYIADIIANFFKENNINSAIIDLGGNLYVLGLKPSGEKWKIGIQNPFSERGNIIGNISETNKSIVTSGIYERFIEKDNIKYHHILNPSTGYPYENNIAGITIVSDKSLDGDALSTTVFSKGLEEGLSLIESLENTEAIFITNDKKVYISSGLKNNFTITNSEFQLSN